MKTKRTKACVVEALFRTSFCTKTSTRFCTECGLVHCTHLPLILFACASSGQSYNIDSPVVPNCCDVIDTWMTGDPIAF